MWLVAAEQVPQADNSQLLLGIIGLLGVAITAAGAVVVALINTRNRTAPSPPATTGDPRVDRLAERVAVLERRAQDKDNQLHYLDVAVDKMQAYLDRLHGGWR